MVWQEVLDMCVLDISIASSVTKCVIGVQSGTLGDAHCTETRYPRRMKAIGHQQGWDTWRSYNV